MALKSVLPPTKNPPRSEFRQVSRTASFHNYIRQNFNVSTWLLFGALIQSIVVFFIPRFYAFLPVVLILLARFFDTLAITLKFKSNPYLKDSILHRVAPQVPNADGTFSNEPSDEKITVFFLGAKSNHPLGIFAPHFKFVGDMFSEMGRELDNDSTKAGFYGMSTWNSQDQHGATTTLFISYWRSADDIHRYAYGPTHKKVWDWWSAHSKEISHIGISHEIFEVDRKHWEAIYINYQPSLLGATKFLKKGDKDIGGSVEDEWVSGLVDARSGKLRTSSGRLGRNVDALKDKYGYDGYGADEEK